MRGPSQVLLLACWAACVARPVSAQQISLTPPVRVASRPYAPHTPQFSAQTDMVEVSVVVRDRAGHPVANLPSSSFRLFDDGAPRTINAFSVETAPGLPSAAGPGVPVAQPVAAASADTRPRYVAMFFDDYSMDFVNLAMARNAAEKLKAGSLRGPVRLGVFTSSGAVTMDFTADTAAWDAAFKKLQYRARMPPEGIINGTGFSAYFAYQVLLSPSKFNPFSVLARSRMRAAGLCFTPDACQTVLLAEAKTTVSLAEDVSRNTLEALQRAIAYLSIQPGSRVLLLTSSGFLTATIPEREEAVVNQALRGGVVIDTLDAKLLNTEPLGSSALEHIVDYEDSMGLDDVLASLADATGGTFFSNNNDISGAMRRMASEPEIRYVLSFSPGEMPFDGKYHKLKVTVAGLHHDEVQARKGYYDPDQDEDLFRRAPQATLDAAVLGTAKPAAVPTTLAASWKKGELRVVANVDIAHFRFDKQDAMRRESLVFTSAVFDSHGRFVVGKTGAMGLDLTDAGRARMAKSGVAASLSLPLAPGRYRLREVIVEGNRGLLTVLDRQIQVSQ